MPKIVRTMLKQDNLPVVGIEAHKLGARVPNPDQPEKAVDVTPDEAGQVHPNRGGLSVARSVYDLPGHLVPRRLNRAVEGATANNLRFVWNMGKGLFFEGPVTKALNLKLKPNNTPRQQLGLVEPAVPMHLDDYQMALAQTRHAWSLDEIELNEP